MITECGRVSESTKGLPFSAPYRDALPAPNCYKSYFPSDVQAGPGCPPI